MDNTRKLSYNEILRGYVVDEINLAIQDQNEQNLEQLIYLLKDLSYKAIQLQMS